LAPSGGGRPPSGYATTAFQCQVVCCASATSSGHLPSTAVEVVPSRVALIAAPCLQISLLGPAGLITFAMVR
jgi:hypothetical protein